MNKKKYKKSMKKFLKELKFIKKYDMVELTDKANESLRKKYPNAPEAMIDAAAFPSVQNLESIKFPERTVNCLNSFEQAGHL